jgi:hypothetical protein
MVQLKARTFFNGPSECLNFLSHERGAPQIDLFVALSEDLDKSLVDKHLDALTTALADVIKVIPRRSRKEIREALAAPKVELIYFYCHGLRQSVSTAAAIPVLGIGASEEFATRDLYAWESEWEKGHWQETSPLVFINGCHTAELTPEILVNFVDAFVGVYAAGVIGTEIMLHQQVANEAGQLFFDSFKNHNCSVGLALQHVRRSLLLKGNLLGLAYTPYCSADLHLS